MKIGCCSPIKYYKDVKLLGYDYIELSGTEVYNATDDEWNSFVELYHKIQLPVLGFNAYCDEKLPIVGDGFSQEATTRYAEILTSRGAQVHIKNLGIGAPKARQLIKEYDIDKANSQAINFLKITSSIAKQYNQQVLFEALHPLCCNYVTHTQDAINIVKQCNDPNIGIVLDFYHMEVAGEDITSLNDFMPYVRHLHTSGNGINHQRDFLTMQDKDKLVSLKNAIHTYNDTISIESVSTNFIEDAKVNLDVMRSIFK